jgi:cysteine desulfurase
VHALVGASSVDSVVRVTGNFASENPLHPAAREALLAAFDQGWADPKKLSQNSAKAAILKNQAVENIASHLGVPVSSIEILGEPSLGHFLSIAGLFHGSSPFIYSAVDKGKIRALARAHSYDVNQLSVTSSGAILSLGKIPNGSVLSFQLANTETGVIQKDCNDIPGNVRVAVDATASGPRLALPEQWNTALFDSLSWNGPGGLAILAIKDRALYSYPLPHIAPISVPGSYSLPLLIASSVAIENFISEDANLRDFALAQFSQVPGAQVVAAESDALPHLFSIVAEGVTGERVVRELATLGIDVDSGSACSAEDLQPSHVLAAMGYETTGHLRFTLHQGIQKEDIEKLVESVSTVLEKLRR